MSRASINLSSRRRRRRRSPRPLALILIAGGIGLFGYAYWPAAKSDPGQAALSTETTPAPRPVTTDKEPPEANASPAEPNLSSSETTPAINEPAPIRSDQVLPAIDQAQEPDPVVTTVPPVVPVAEVVIDSNVAPAIRQRALADFSSGMRLIKDGLGVEGRQRLSDALGSEGLDRARAEEVRDVLSELSETLVFGSGVAQRDPFAREFIIPEGGVLAKIAQNQTNGLHWKFLARINSISRPSRIRSGQRLKLMKGPFHAVVDKSDYRLDLWMGPAENRVYVRSFDVGIGRDNRTPEGQFQVSSRVENPQHTDPETGKVFDKDDPLNPVGEHWIAIKGTEPATEKLSGFGFHGTIEENSIGRSESLGCVRMLPSDIALLYEVLGPGRSEIEIRP